MYALRIYVGTQQLDPLAIVEMHLMSDLDSLCYTGALRIKDGVGAMYSKMTLGLSVKIQYLDEQGRKKLDCPLRVLSYEKLATRSPGMVDELTLTLISDWYYKQQPVTRAFFGSISSIAADVVRTDSFFKAKLIEESSDAKSLRYQVGRSSLEFFKTIAKYAVRDISAMFMYGTVDQEFVLKSIKAIQGSTPLYTLVPFLDGRADVLPTGFSYPILGIFSIAFYADGSRTAGSRKYFFTTDHMPSADLASTKTSVDLKTLESNETLLVSSIIGSDATILGWEISPSDAIAMTINQTEKLNQDLLSIVVIVPSTIGSGLSLGSVVKLYLNANLPPENGSYYVKHIDYQYSDANSYTKLQLIRIPQ